MRIFITGQLCRVLLAEGRELTESVGVRPRHSAAQPVGAGPALLSV